MSGINPIKPKEKAMETEKLEIKKVVDKPIAVVRRVRMIDRRPVVVLENQMSVDIAGNLDKKTLMRKSLDHFKDV